jgi:hypothetical protein
LVSGTYKAYGVIRKFECGDAEMIITSVIASDSEKNYSEEWQLYENKKGSENAQILNL